jgi:UDP-N-acetylmuramyl-tripeptide synthetase
MVAKLKQLKITITKLIPGPLLNFYHYLWTLTGAIKYQFPAKKLLVIGITGTKGKTTTCHLVYFLLQRLGIKTALSSSEKFYLGDEVAENTSRVSMPGRWFLQKFLREAVDKHCEAAVIEVTSEGLMQNRHGFIDFDIAVFLNIHPEHIEHHGGYEEYKLSKGKLFQNLLRGKNKYFRGKLIKKTIVANLDDREADYFLGFPAQQKITYSLEVNTGLPLHLCPQKIQLGAKNSIFKIDDITFSLRSWGKQNVYNAIAGLAALRALDMPLSLSKQPLAEFVNIPGRFELVQSKGLGVIIDYAHTPESIEKLYQNIHMIFEPKRLLCLIGSAGGLRDKWKRPVIGEIAAKYCNRIVVSNEDPFDEDPLVIMKSIELGIKKYLEEYDFCKDYKIIEDRKEAISDLINCAEKEDIVVLIGKGSEKSIETKNGSIPWDEKQVVLEVIGNLKKPKNTNGENVSNPPFLKIQQIGKTNKKIPRKSSLGKSRIPKE